MEKQPKPSKSFVKLRNRLKTTKEHLETVEEALRTNRRKDNSPHVSHSIARNSESALQLLYTHLNEFLKSILSEMFRKKPLPISGKAQGSLQYHEIVKLGSYEAICEYIVDEIFRKLDNERNTGKLIKKIVTNTPVEVGDEIFSDAMYYVDIRHLLVHNSCRVDKIFVEKYKSRCVGIKEGDKVPSSSGVAKEAIKAVQKLCQEIDQSLVSNGYIDPNRTSC